MAWGLSEIPSLIVLVVIAVQWSRSEDGEATRMDRLIDDLRTLVITTAREDMTEADVAAHPASGRLFTTRVDVPGLPSRPWRGEARGEATT